MLRTEDRYEASQCINYAHKADFLSDLPPQRRQFDLFTSKYGQSVLDHTHTVIVQWDHSIHDSTQNILEINMCILSAAQIG